MTGGQLDPEIVRRHLLALDQAIQNLRRHAGATLERLRSDQDERWIVERGLQVCAQNVLDVATHLVAAAGRDAQDYTAAIDQLVGLGVLPGEFTARLRGLAGFRNVLVHAYLDVDLARLCRVLNERLDDLGEFARLVQDYLERSARAD